MPRWYTKMDKEPRSLGHWISLRRRELKLSQKQFAALVGVTYAWLSMIERGVATPSPDLLSRICNLVDRQAPAEFTIGLKKIGRPLKLTDFDSLDMDKEASR
jgi:transcriptional regulator with XRE-family HTH domain